MYIPILRALRPTRNPDTISAAPGTPARAGAFLSGFEGNRGQNQSPVAQRETDVLYNHSIAHSIPMRLRRDYVLPQQAQMEEDKSYGNNEVKHGENQVVS